MFQEEETPEALKKLLSNFKTIAGSFKDPQKLEENLQSFHQMNDESVFTAFSTLLDPSTSFGEAITVRVCSFVHGIQFYACYTRVLNLLSLYGSRNTYGTFGLWDGIWFL